MEGSQLTESRAGKNQDVDQEVLMTSKPLHRFVQREPRSLGIVIGIFGIAELLMGFHLSSETLPTSCGIYIPYWEGLLFLVCGILSIYTEIHPSKKMVTVCLALYIVSLLGIVVSVLYRIHCFLRYSFGFFRYTTYSRVNLLVSIEGLLFTSSLCVSGLLIFLCAVARLALKSTRTQVVVQHLPPQQSDTASN